MRLDTGSSGTDSAKERETQTSHRERQTDRQTDGLTDTESDRQTEHSDSSTVAWSLKFSPDVDHDTDG